MRLYLNYWKSIAFPLTTVCSDKNLNADVSKLEWVYCTRKVIGLLEFTEVSQKMCCLPIQLWHQDGRGDPKCSIKIYQMLQWTGGEQHILQELFTILKEVFGTSITISLLRLWRKEKEFMVLLNKLTTIKSYFNVNRKIYQRTSTLFNKMGQVVKGNLGYEILNSKCSNL